MKLYLDASALVRFVNLESSTEDHALTQFLEQHFEDDRVTSVLSRAEVVRAVMPGGPNAVALAQLQLARCHQIDMDVETLDRASLLSAGQRLRSHEVIHLASAKLLGADLRALVTYDSRILNAAINWGLPVKSPWVPEYVIHHGEPGEHEVVTPYPQLPHPSPRGWR